MRSTLRVTEVDVFATGPFTGNGLAVVHGADHLTDEQLQAVARWTQFSETAFLLRPTVPGADYRVRILTPVTEYAFAGHPTLGAAHAWLGAGGVPGSRSDGGTGTVGTGGTAGTVVQECGIGLVTVRRDGAGAEGTEGAPGRTDQAGALLSFAAPERTRTGPLAQDDLARVLDALGLTAADVVAHAWGSNGPQWRMVELADAEAVRAVGGSLVGTGLRCGVVGVETDPGAGVAYEVRAFTSQHEDAVTGSLQASVAQWMRERGRVPRRWTAAQGGSVGRAGRVELLDDGHDVWVGGRCATRVSGTLHLG